MPSLSFVPRETCPRCLKAEGIRLPMTSEIAVVDYYRCDDCGYVWTDAKDTHYEDQPTSGRVQ